MDKLDAAWLHDKNTTRVAKALAAAGGAVFYVGGCVRNSLLGEPVSDIDLCTDLRPEAVMQAASNAGLKPVPTGIEHGTVTVISRGVPHEVTTFRRDVATDGRRAVVAFSDRIEDDALRRDFTMNALYARPDGSIVDPVGGLPDLRARRFRFIGDAQARICEDYLRSLRFFRFHAWYGDPQAGMDAEALAAIAANLDGVDRVSRERIGAELIKLLTAPDPAPAVAAMRATGLLVHVLPGADDRALAPLIHMEQQAGRAPDPIRRLAALGGDAVADRLRLSKARASELDRLRAGLGSFAGAGELGYRAGLEPALDILTLRAAMNGQPWNPAEMAATIMGANAVFPVSASDLMPTLSGKALGDRLRMLEQRWIASGFSLTRDQLLA